MMSEIYALLRELHIPVIVMLVIAVIIILFGSPVVAKLMELVAKKRKAVKKKLCTKDLQEHSFFEFMDYCLNIRIKQLDFKTEFKNNAFHDLLYIKYKIFRDNIREFVSWYLQYNIPSALFKTEVTYILYNCLQECEHKWRDTGIPDIEYIISRFTNWHSVTNEFIQKYIRKTLSSEIYDNDMERLSTILDIYSIAFEVALLDVESDLQKINGRFIGKEYKSKLL